MQLGLMVFLGDHMEDRFRALAELGVPTCQLACWQRELLTQERAEETRLAAQRQGIRISAFWCGWSGPVVWDFYEGQLTLGLVPPAYSHIRLQELLHGARFARWLGVEDLVTHAGYIPENPYDEKYPALIANLRHLAKELAAHGQWLVFETGQETPCTLRRAIEDVGTGNLGVNLDPANLLMYGKANPVDALDILGSYVRGVHAKDGEYPANGRELGPEKPLGQGRVNFPKFMEKLREVGYDGCVTIEREIEGEQQRRDILRALEILRGLMPPQGGGL